MAFWVPTVEECEDAGGRAIGREPTECGTNVETVAWFLRNPSFINAHELFDEVE